MKIPVSLEIIFAPYNEPGKKEKTQSLKCQVVDHMNINMLSYNRPLGNSHWETF